MIIDCISDLHGHYPTLEGGDLLIVAGDLTAADTEEEYFKALIWIEKQSYKKVILVAGNHDNHLYRFYNEYEDNLFQVIEKETKIDYLCDSVTEFEGYKIWGSPWTLKFEGMNPACMAFTCDTEEELSEKWALIRDDVDILVTHSPPYGLADETIRGERVGSKSLQMEALRFKNIRLWVVGHIHEAYGKETEGHFYDCILLNASHVNEHYKPVNKPVRVIL